MNRCEYSDARHRSLILFLVFLAFSSGLLAHSAESTIAIRVTSPLNLNMIKGAGPVHAHAIILRNTGKTALAWSASANQTWLKFEPASGSLDRNAQVAVDVVASPEGFSPGAYEAIAQIVAGKGEPRSLTVTMTEESAFSGILVANAERTFPPDSGMVNVKTQYGAKGDGVSDDTAAIQRAVTETVHHPNDGPRIVYFPAGTYLVSKPILEKDLKGQWSSLLTIQGENRATTTLKLTDKNPQYQDGKSPADVLTLASQHGGVVGGGNQAFDNNVFDITIDVGRGNPGAVALDFMGNNYCALRNVTLQSSDPDYAGAIGLDLHRYAIGPCLMKNVLITGFDYGVKAVNNEYSVTFEDLGLAHQKVYGIYNASNVLSIRRLVSDNSVPAIFNKNASGLITLLDAMLRGGSRQNPAIQNEGTLYARNVRSSGYSSLAQGRSGDVPGPSVAEYDSGPPAAQSENKNLSLNLPIEETPYFEDTRLANWKSVVSYGADPTGKADSASAIQSAIDSGATTVYFPTGVYVVSHTILIRGKVRVVEGFGSSLNPWGKLFQDPSNPAPLLQVDAGTSEVALNHMRLGAFYAAPCPGVIGVQQNSARPFVFRDSIVGGPPGTIGYRNTSQGTGTLFVEDVAARPWEVLFPQKVFARQINPEGNMTKITNRGGSLWILGLKTEGTGTNIDTSQGGATEVLGGLIYPVWRIPPDTPNFIVNESRASLIYAVSSYKPAEARTNFSVQVQEIHRGVSKSLLSTSLPERGLGTMVPLYRSSEPSGYSPRESKPAGGNPSPQ